MLRFTPTQQALLLNNRRGFNQRQAQLNSSGIAMLGNALPLPKDVWGQWDREGVELQRQMLTVFNDLAGLSKAIPIGKLMAHFQTISDSGTVNISLDGRSKAKTDQPTFEYFGTPIPIVDSTFSFGWRQVEAAQTEGVDLESAGRTNANFKVLEKAESIVLNGDATIVYNAQPLYGLRNYPYRNTRTTGVALNGATGPQWLAEVIATLNLLHADNFKVPAVLYLNWDDWFYASNTDYSAQYPNKTIAQRVMETMGIERVLPSDSIAASEIIGLVRDRRVVEVLNAMPFSTRAQYRANPEDEYDFVVMMAAALQIKHDAAQNCGLAHSTI